MDRADHQDRRNMNNMGCDGLKDHSLYSVQQNCATVFLSGFPVLDTMHLIESIKGWLQ